MKLQINFDNEKGHGYWKFDNTLLKDMEYVKKIKNIIKGNLDRYSVVNNDNNNNGNVINGTSCEAYMKKEFVINDQLLLETNINSW